MSIVLLLGFGGSAGCRTEFVGEARFPGGAQACARKCSDINMEMATFVYVGEYSTACACKPVRRPHIAAAGPEETAAEGALVAAAAGVVMQARDAEAAAAAANQPHVFAP